MHLKRLSTCRLGLGLAALGRPGYLNLGHAEDLAGDYRVDVMQQKAFAVLDAAWASGIRYFDVARSYGKAELFLANWLTERRIDRSTLLIGSKWGYTYTADWQVQCPQHEVKDHSVEVLRRQWAESCAIFGQGPDLYQIHSATPESGVLENEAVLNELARMRESGVRIGLSLSGPSQAATLRQAMDITRDGKPLFNAVQATWNLLEPSAGEALADAHSEGYFVVIKEALANGRLTSRNPDPEMHARLSAAAQRHPTSIDALCLSAALAQPWADIVLSGAATVPHLQSNLTALHLPYPDPSLSDLAESSNTYWTSRKQLPWN